MNQYALAAVLGRLLMAILFILSGVGKMAAPAATQGYIASLGLPSPLLALVIAIAVELGGGILLAIGYRTRIVSLGLVAFTVATALLFHNNLADQMQMIQFLKNLAITGGLLQIAAFGAGPLSLDGRRFVAA
ncbi:putative oxidoreductase [Bosea sp. OK403]|uniref:DoxX family protein n=1 Tax=Bosea sp. OK403 TaxID=1855286 RepID=UPI0008EB4EE1|nr:DoxX family protein [Bosea sp. OK403]SFJ74332.1 putative oxidoreductase [Bosea sp. OK403]